jgi:hypothetical protein
MDEVKKQEARASFGESQLALYGKGGIKALEILLKKRASTSAKQMELKRRELAALTLSVESLLSTLNIDQDGKEIQDTSAPDYIKKLNTVNLLGSVATIKALEYICDCLSWRQRVKFKSGEEGVTRITAADTLTELATMLSNDEDGVVENLDMISSMLNEIGIAWNAFKDKNGVTDKNKYYQAIEAKHEKQEVQVEENEAVTEQEAASIENTTPEEILSKLGKKKSV